MKPNYLFASALIVLAFFSHYGFAQESTEIKRLTRPYEFSSYNYTTVLALADRLYGPKTFMEQIGISVTQLTFRTVGHLFTGSVYNYLVEAFRGENPSFLRAVQFYFNDNTFESTVLRNWRNWSQMIFGRVVLNLIFYGPHLFLDGIFNTGTVKPYEVWKYPLGNGRTTVFIKRMAVEGVALIVGWVFYLFLGQILYAQVGNPRPTGRGIKVKRSLHRDLEAQEKFEQKLKQQFDRIIEILEATTQYDSL